MWFPIRKQIEQPICVLIVGDQLAAFRTVCHGFLSDLVAPSGPAPKFRLDEWTAGLVERYPLYRLRAAR
jgi:hypothetical protein